MLQRFFQRDRPLTELYSRFSERWQAGIENLGFPAAYRHLISRFKTRQAATGAMQPHRILDIGTGSGAMAVAFLDQHPLIHEVALLDSCKEMLPLAEQNLARFAVPTTCHLSSAEAPLPGPPHDIALAAHVIEHTDHPLATLGRIYDALAPGGTAILSVSKPHWCTAIVRWRWGHRAFRPEDVTEMLRQAGFTRIEIIAYPSGPPARVSAGYIATRP